MKSEQNLNAVKQKFEGTKYFKGSACKRVEAAKVDLLAHLSFGEHSGPFV